MHLAARTTKAAHQYQLALVIGAVMMTVGAALVLKLSALFAPLMLGMVVRSLERSNLVADIEFGPSFELFFIVLFVYAGANMHVSEMLHYWPAALAFVFARSAAKWLGVTLTAAACRTPLQQASASGLLLMPMAGLAIGLVNTTVALFPREGLIVGSTVLAAVAILETIGPPIAARALRWSGTGWAKRLTALRRAPMAIASRRGGHRRFGCPIARRTACMTRWPSGSLRSLWTAPGGLRRYSRVFPCAETGIAGEAAAACVTVPHAFGIQRYIRRCPATSAQGPAGHKHPHQGHRRTA